MLLLAVYALNCIRPVVVVVRAIESVASVVFCAACDESVRSLPALVVVEATCARKRVHSPERDDNLSQLTPTDVGRAGVCG